MNSSEKANDNASTSQFNLSKQQAVMEEVNQNTDIVIENPFLLLFENRHECQFLNLTVVSSAMLFKIKFLK